MVPIGYNQGMSVKELIEKLQSFPPDMDVRVGDWNEAYAAPWDLGPSEIFIREHPHGRDPSAKVPFVQIGKD